ncbi:CKLF-like MARVEL transmembrane domain-containing protein 4 [Littorina saxatilis]|uniref:MARVEL domain-containing protein n=1 Tax=Littorina saxatilis TaxID=31220 RepID=A0AAN9C5U1_9CAEN
MDDSDDQNSSQNVEEEIQRELSESDSASCNSISNPYYDGPKREVSDLMEGERDGDQLNRCCPGTSRGGFYQSPIKNNEMIIVSFYPGYFKTCIGFLRTVQLILTSITLLCLVVAGHKEGGLLNLPLEWHFRIMLFVLVLTFLTSLVIVCANVTSVINVLVVEWNLVDMVLYSVFAFLYLVGTSLVASAFDFYQKMKTNVSSDTVQQLITVVVLGYICMVAYGLTALVSYRHWRIQYRLYQRRKLLEEDEIDL